MDCGGKVHENVRFSRFFKCLLNHLFSYSPTEYISPAKLYFDKNVFHSVLLTVINQVI